ncbi:MAG: thiol-disulfide oxidoreductase DCC family protein [Candidatus Acidiferrum sp.]
MAARMWITAIVAAARCQASVLRRMAVVARSPVPKLTVLYDGACNMCRASVNRVRRMDPRGRIELLDLDDASVSVRFPQVDIDEAMRLMQAVDPAGRVYSGADAWARIGMALPGWNLLAWLLLVPGIRFVAKHVYGWVARNRYRWNREICEDGTCTLHVEPRSTPQK